MVPAKQHWFRFAMQEIPNPHMYQIPPVPLPLHRSPPLSGGAIYPAAHPARLSYLARASGKHVPDTGAQRLLTGSYQHSARAYVSGYCLEDMLVRDIFLNANSAPPGTDTGLKPSVQGASPPSTSLSH